jgi:DNA mismatch repair protein MutL
LESLETFGFRGEALSSLCALANITITTRHESSIIGHKIEYDKNGLIKAKIQCARSVGTTVLMEKLFHTLPVRYKEFLRNLKREYHKLMHVIQCYCLISEGVKLNCSHIMGEKSTKLMSTHSKNSLRENIIEIFGLSCINSMAKFIQCEPDDEILIEYKLKSAPTSQASSSNESQVIDESINESDQSKNVYSNLFKIEGFISNCSHGQGRNAPDRQYIYVNKRPCDHSRITKLINECYHKFNRTQYPMFVLNIYLDSRDVDVNVTPDKLQMFLKNESALLAIIKTSLMKLFNEQYKSLNVNEISFNNQKNSSNSQLMESFFSYQKAPAKTNTQQKLADLSDDEEDEKENQSKMKEKHDKNVSEKMDTSAKLPETKGKRSRDCLNESDILIDEDENSNKSSKLDKKSPFKTNQINQPKNTLPKFLDNYLKTYNTPSPKKAKQNDENSEPVVGASARLELYNGSSNVKDKEDSNESLFTTKDRLSFFQTRIGYNSKLNESKSSLNDSLSERIDLHLCNKKSNVLDTPPAFRKKNSDDSIVDLNCSPVPPTLPSQNNVRENLKLLGLTMTQDDHDLTSFKLPSNATTPVSEQVDKIPSTNLSAIVISKNPQHESTRLVSNEEETPTQSNLDDSITPSLKEEFAKRKVKLFEYKWDDLVKNHHDMIEKNKIEMNTCEEDEKNLIKNLKFKSRNIDSKDAENELDRCITQEDFLRMEVKGQFNKGFIIAQLDQVLFFIYIVKFKLFFLIYRFKGFIYN